MHLMESWCRNKTLITTELFAIAVRHISLWIGNIKRNSGSSDGIVTFQGPVERKRNSEFSSFLKLSVDMYNPDLTLVYKVGSWDSYSYSFIIFQAFLQRLKKSLYPVNSGIRSSYNPPQLFSRKPHVNSIPMHACVFCYYSILLKIKVSMHECEKSANYNYIRGIKFVK